ncbi:MAG TPA: efflux RND transporter periplasmic adaptor subunit [Steroidobacteraceae bacterium]
MDTSSSPTISRSGAAPLLALAALLSACHAHPAAQIPPVAVVTYTAHTSDDEDPPTYPAEVAPRYSNPLSFRVAGKVLDRRVRLGDRVTAGEVLAQLDPTDQQRQVASAKAALAAAQHRLHYAQQQLDRDESQFSHQLIAANQLEQTEDAHAAALAARDRAAAELTVAENALSYHTLRADHDGFITAENADTGQVVTASQAVYQLAWSGDIDVVLDAAANDANHMVVGQAARVVLPSVHAQALEAHVREIAPAADPQSRTFRIKLTLNDPAPGIRLGTIGEATLLPPQGDAPAREMAIPSTALFHQGAQPAVWVLEGAKPRLALRAVTVQSYRDRSVVLGSGLRDGERIVAAGVHTVFVGERVTASVSPFDSDEPAAAADGTALRSAQLAREMPR